MRFERKHDLPLNPVCIYCEDSYPESYRNDACICHTGERISLFYEPLPRDSYVYMWSCCGEYIPPEYPPRKDEFRPEREKSPSCPRSRTHKFECRVAIISDISDRDILPQLEQTTLSAIVIALDNFLKNLALPQDVECVVLLDSSDSSTEHRVLTAFNEARDPLRVLLLRRGAKTVSDLENRLRALMGSDRAVMKRHSRGRP